MKRISELCGNCKSGDSHPRNTAVSAVAHARLLSDSRALINGHHASCDMVIWNAGGFAVTYIYYIYGVVMYIQLKHIYI